MYALNSAEVDFIDLNGFMDNQNLFCRAKVSKTYTVLQLAI